MYYYLYIYIGLFTYIHISECINILSHFDLFSREQIEELLQKIPIHNIYI